MDARDHLAMLIQHATKADSQLAQYQRLPGNMTPVYVEIVNGVPTYFIGDEEVTATQAVEHMEAKL